MTASLIEGVRRSCSVCGNDGLASEEADIDILPKLVKWSKNVEVLRNVGVVGRPVDFVVQIIPEHVRKHEADDFASDYDMISRLEHAPASGDAKPPLEILCVIVKQANRQRKGLTVARQWRSWIPTVLWLHESDMKEDLAWECNYLSVGLVACKSILLPPEELTPRAFPSTAQRWLEEQLWLELKRQS